ncbi:unnamed protein product [Merluccius merluccius]
MKTGKALQLSCYGLCLTLTLFGHVTVAQLPEPRPVDCSYSDWSAWTPCNPCTKEARRSRAINAFGQFNGAPCLESLGEAKPCTTGAACAAPPACSAQDFQCGSGACIKKRLACNYDFDCEDLTDEEACDRMQRKPCTRAVDTKDRGMSDVGQGISIMGTPATKKVLYNGYYGGVCQLVSMSNIRLPWNVASLTFETHAEKTVSNRVLDSSQHLVGEVLTEARFKIKGVLSINSKRFVKAAKLEMIDVIEDVIKNAATSKRFMRVNTKVQLANYRLRPRDLRLADGFLKDIRSLPAEYEKGAYMDFIEDYGTHYTRSGKLGGEYNLIYVLNNEEIKKRTVVDKVLISVKGGDSASISAMKAKITAEGQLDAETYRTWSRSISDQPGLLSSERDPIYNLVPLDMPDANDKTSNLKRAMEDFVAEFSICKCNPCHNNGTVVLIDGMCSCLCTSAFKGLACQNPRADEVPAKEPRPSVPRPSVPRPSVPRPSVPVPSVRHEGNWACWSGWSACGDEGNRSRRRACNVAGLPLGGCTGEDMEAEDC